MANTVSEIKPDGTGDFTTLTSWNTWAAGQSSAGQTALCYSGGDLGQCELDSSYGWPMPTPSEHPIIRVAEGERHEGRRDQGAYIDHSEVSSTYCIETNLDYVEIWHLRMSRGGPETNSGVYIRSDNCLVDGILCSGIGSYGVNAQCGSKEAVTVRNCIVEGAGSDSYFLNVTNSEGTLYLYNCLAYGSGAWEHYLLGGDPTYAHNIMAFGNPIFYPSHENGSAGHNMSSDETADDWLGSGHYINAVADDEFQDPQIDYNLLETGDAFEGGEAIGSFDHDAVNGSGWRPQGSAWDIGALELGGGGAQMAFDPIFRHLLAGAR